MRLKPLPPATLGNEQLVLHQKIGSDISKFLQGFVSQRSDGALIGPFIPMINFPQFGAPAWDYLIALIDNGKLSKPAHEVAILVTGAHFRSRYEIYAHEHVATNAGLSEAKIATITAGERPNDLNEEEAITYDVTSILCKGGQLPESTYKMAVKILGEEVVAELVYLVGGYCLVSVLLNAYDISVPGRDDGLE